MRDTAVSARYAKALSIVTEKRKETTRALEDLQSLNQVFRPGTPIANFLASPQIRLADKHEALKKGIGGRVLPTVAVFVELLLRKKRLRDFPTIVEEFEALVEKSLGIQRARVVSAVPLKDDETRRLHEALERYTHAKIRLTSGVDPSLLGGALVRIGDRVVDRTVRTLLESIEKQLEEVSV